MSYTSHTWTNNELITAEKMNALEQGITDCCNGALYVHFLNNTTSDTKVSDIISAFTKGYKVILYFNNYAQEVCSIKHNNSTEEYVIFASSENNFHIPESHLNDILQSSY